MTAFVVLSELCGIAVSNPGSSDADAGQDIYALLKPTETLEASSFEGNFGMFNGGSVTTMLTDEQHSSPMLPLESNNMQQCLRRTSEAKHMPLRASLSQLLRSLSVPTISGDNLYQQNLVTLSAPPNNCLGMNTTGCQLLTSPYSSPANFMQSHMKQQANGGSPICQYAHNNTSQRNGMFDIRAPILEYMPNPQQPEHQLPHPATAPVPTFTMPRISSTSSAAVSPHQVARQQHRAERTLVSISTDCQPCVQQGPHRSPRSEKMSPTRSVPYIPRRSSSSTLPIHTDTSLEKLQHSPTLATFQVPKLCSPDPRTQQDINCFGFGDALASSMQLGSDIFDTSVNYFLDRAINESRAFPCQNEPAVTTTETNAFPALANANACGSSNTASGACTTQSSQDSSLPQGRRCEDCGASQTAQWRRRKRTVISMTHPATGQVAQIRLGDCCQSDALETTVGTLSRIHGKNFDESKARQSLQSVLLCNACGLKDMYHSNRTRTSLLAGYENEMT